MNYITHKYTYTHKYMYAHTHIRTHARTEPEQCREGSVPTKRSQRSQKNDFKPPCEGEPQSFQFDYSLGGVCLPLLLSPHVIASDKTAINKTLPAGEIGLQSFPHIIASNKTAPTAADCLDITLLQVSISGVDDGNGSLRSAPSTSSMFSVSSNQSARSGLSSRSQSDTSSQQTVIEVGMNYRPTYSMMVGHTSAYIIDTLYTVFDTLFIMYS